MSKLAPESNQLVEMNTHAFKKFFPYIRLLIKSIFHFVQILRYVLSWRANRDFQSLDITTLFEQKSIMTLG